MAARKMKHWESTPLAYEEWWLSHGLDSAGDFTWGSSPRKGRQPESVEEAKRTFTKWLGKIRFREDYVGYVEGARRSYHVHLILKRGDWPLDLVERFWRADYGIADLRPASIRTNCRRCTDRLICNKTSRPVTGCNDSYRYVAQKFADDGVHGNRIFGRILGGPLAW